MTRSAEPLAATAGLRGSGAGRDRAGRADRAVAGDGPRGRPAQARAGRDRRGRPEAGRGRRNCTTRRAGWPTSTSCARRRRRTVRGERLVRGGSGQRRARSGCSAEARAAVWRRRRTRSCASWRRGWPRRRCCSPMWVRSWPGTWRTVRRPGAAGAGAGAAGRAEGADPQVRRRRRRGAGLGADAQTRLDGLDTSEEALAELAAGATSWPPSWRWPRRR